VSEALSACARELALSPALSAIVLEYYGYGFSMAQFVAQIYEYCPLPPLSLPSAAIASVCVVCVCV
jgi:hypothetical protein